MQQDIQLQLAREIESIRTSVDELKRFLMGNGQPGEIEKHDKRITTLENWRWLVVGLAVGVGAAGTHIVEALLK